LNGSASRCRVEDARAGRTDFSHTDGGGYVERTGDKMQSGAASLVWTPRPSVNVRGQVVTVHNGFFAATQYVKWRNFENTQFVPATRLVQVGSYFLAKRDDLRSATSSTCGRA
jgi:hypothetical protein